MVEKSLEYCEGLKKYLKENGNKDTKNPFKYKENSLHIKFGKEVATVQNNNDKQLYNFGIKEKGNKKEVYPKLEAYPGLGISLESIKAIYRNLRENYEFRFDMMNLAISF